MDGKVAIVTGGARGIGKGIVSVLAGEGAKVMFTDISKERGEATETELRGQGLELSFLEADTSRAADAEAMAQATIDRYGRIDVLCPNAGIFPETRIENISESEWDEVCAVNLKGPFLVSKACLPQMKKQGSGRIVVTSSITGPRVSSPGHGHYAATKAGVLGFIRTAALEWAPFGITINAVEPGNILTEGMKLHRDQSFIDSQRAAVPSGRLGTPEDVAHAILFLASDEAEYITGQSIVVDGGQILPEMPSAILPRR
jgi:3-oxoacyl-[acyl-carrier protein] reductase